MALLLSCKDLNLEYPTKRVLHDITLGVFTGDRIGIVGRNGGGKSSLMGVLSGRIQADSGELVRQSAVTVGTLEQGDELDADSTVLHAVVGDAPLHSWASVKETREILDALLADIPADTRISELSGGQRRRVDLARLLIGDWDVLMLDEPTNHLDVATITWLAEHLKNRWGAQAGALLLISHDRWFLDELCSSMWEVHDAIVDPFEGGYSAYILQRAERERVAAVTEQRRQNLLRKELAWLARGPQARATKPKFRINAAWDLIENEPAPRNEFELKRMAMSRLGKQVLELENVGISYGGKKVIEGLNWRIGPGDRYGILGENGSGKTSLLKVLEQKLTPATGELRVGKTVQLAVLSQELEDLSEVGSLRIRELLAEFKSNYEVEGRKLSPAQLIERLGFESAHLQARVDDLSGGQKRQLSLLMALMKEPNVLILDEPGNDLDTDTLAALEDLLDSWPGTLILVSHDRYLMERVTDQQYALIDGALRHVPGGVDEYIRLLAASKSDNDRARFGAELIEAGQSAASTAKDSSSAKLSGGAAYEARKQLSSLERKLQTLNKQREDLAELASSVDPADYQALIDHQEATRTLAAQISELETQWIELSESLD